MKDRYFTYCQYDVFEQLKRNDVHIIYGVNNGHFAEVRTGSPDIPKGFLICCDECFEKMKKEPYYIQELHPCEEERRSYYLDSEESAL